MNCLMCLAVSCNDSLEELDKAAIAYLEKCPEKEACVGWISGTAAYYCLPKNISAH